MRLFPLALAGLTLLSACKRKTPPPPPAAPAHPMTPSVQGKLLERIDVPNYTYLRLQSAQGEIWAAVPSATVQVGAQVTVSNTTPMQNFESTTLKRTFPIIYFGTLGQGQPHPMAGMGAGLEPGEKIAKASAPDARTIAELYAQKQQLVNKTVTLRGKVVKYNPGILGKNWIHIQDGTGDQAKRTHDITLTTQDTTTIGQVIQIQGTVKLDQDFGSGYRYPVILENTKIQK